MSMFSFPTEMNTNEMMKAMKPMTDWTKTADLTVSPLMVYPFGAAAAATAVGFGIAGQMAGMMMGAMQGAMQSQNALLGAHPDLSWMVPAIAEDLAPDEEPAAKVVKPAARAETADVVALKPVARPAPVAEAPAKAKARPAKAPVAETSPAPSKDAASVAFEQLKSDAVAAAAGASEPAPVSKTEPTTVAATALAPEDFRRPAEMEKPETPDDLKVISGIGPKLEQVLNGLGVWTFAQIAAWQPEEVAWVDDYLQFKGRIDRDAWISQASGLAKGGVAVE